MRSCIAVGVAVGDNDLVLLNSVHYESESSSGTSMALYTQIGKLCPGKIRLASMFFGKLLRSPIANETANAPGKLVSNAEIS